MINKHVGIVKSWEVTIRRKQAAARKRAKHFFHKMSVSHVDDDPNAPAENVYHAEKVLDNGDFYTGQWSGDLPHGHGKYLWTDGCMYVGEWRAGKPLGQGKFCWPSGATYEGEFKNAYMDGQGTYTGPSGDTYKGSWVMNMKHGQGIKCYVNGDYYEGGWRRGMQDGQGKYQWENGNHYNGQWKNGLINGNGTLVWSNGKRYEGSWEDGLPKGNGTFKWPDGSFYIGVWSRDANDQSGKYTPSSSTASNTDWNPQEVYSVDLQDCKICPGEKLSILPSQKVLNWPGVEGEFLQKQKLCRPSPEHDTIGKRRISVDGRFSDVDNYGNRRSVTGDGLGSLQLEDSGGRRTLTRQQLLRVKLPKRQGVTISKGHKNYELMLNLQLGIRHSVGRPGPAISVDLKPSVFDPKEKVWTRFPSEGSKHTPPHQSCEFKWKDYCPVVFRTLRKLFKVDAADYMISICGNDALRELSSPGKSGSFFYLTNDDRYMIKTMKKSEVKVLLRMLPAYYNHVKNFENTLVTKYFGLHCVKLTGPAQKKVRFIIMGNLFCSNYVFHRRFDLKGSSHGRITDKPDTEIEATTTLKDLDLNFIFRLKSSWYQEFCRQVDRDCDFLEQERIMDYSLLVGLHFRQVSQSGDLMMAEPLGSTVGTPSGINHTEVESEEMGSLTSDTMSGADATLGINMPAMAELTVRRRDSEQAELVGEPTGELYDIVISFGVIDILQDYDISKKLEHAYKSIQYDPTSISAVDPKQYSRRFRDFIFRIFVEDNVG
ncbi:hypothetical protein MLD38_003610 [Melastoma candidum]|uniref:Uncharacterized protein n=1 Tax=Melastoma candidum TaxID=119954 RepID=A0ACB9S392_9MYRT|nr:hypothetical protein MLD38_003610 [Melastoma candidum]